MLFNSLDFLLFFPLVILINFLLPHKYRWVWLLSASYYFYMNWNPTYAILILISTLITYASGILIDKSKDDKRKKLWVALSFTSNLLILFFYKYFNFFGETITDAFNLLGIGIDIPSFDILLPVGISFYTFQALSYTADVYKQKIKPEKHLGIYALFVSFFPQLVAGPIERSSNLLPQFREKRIFTTDNFRHGAMQMLWGFFKKIVIADRLAILVNTVYNNPEQYSGIEIVIATLFFAFQIYCDFSGYTDIAIGAARIMGYDLMQNFKTPYFSKSITEFWRRWHISLSSWFRDYLYIPLGGNRGGITKAYANLFIVFVVSGLWHGASMNFIIWGALHGIYIIIEKWYQKLESTILKPKFLLRLLSTNFYKVTITFTLAVFAWIFFRANTLTDSVTIISNTFKWDWDFLRSNQLFEMGLDKNEFWLAIVSILFLLIIDIYHVNYNMYEKVKKQPTIIRWAVYYIFIFLILIFGYYGAEEQQFIYFQF